MQKETADMPKTFSVIREGSPWIGRVNLVRELGYAKASLKYWQRELHFARKARRPKPATIKRAYGRYCRALDFVALWQQRLEIGLRENEQRKLHWSAFICPTEFGETSNA